MKMLFNIHGVNILLSLITVAMITFMTIMVSTYVKLHYSDPLENFTGYIVSPVDLATDTVLETSGTLDRPVMCNLIDFKVYLTNLDNDDIIVLTPRHLVQAPTASMHPGKNIPVNFSLKIPHTLEVGTWSPVFTGKYVCKLGIFTDVKVQDVLTPAFQVIDSRNKN
jgi:hypothetical protein